MNNRNHYQLSPQDNRRIFEESIVPSLYDNLSAVDEPTALFFRAQPGAGKSLARDRVAEQYDDATVMKIDIDDFRPFHPDYAALQKEGKARAAFYTDLDCGTWTEQAVSLSMETQSHVTLEGTLRNEEPTLRTAQEYAARGMSSELYILAVHELTSRSRIFQRYIDQMQTQGTGRYTLPEAHDVAYNALHGTTRRTVESGLFRQISLVNKDGEVVETVSGQSAMAADTVDTRLRQLRQLTPEDIDAVRAELADIEHAISRQPDNTIRHDFEALVDEVRQQSRRVIGDVAIKNVYRMERAE